MIRVIPVLLLFLFASQANAQRLFSPSDSLNKKRAIIVSSSITTVWAGSMIGLSQLWYKDIPKSKFHFFNDNKEWLQMDKAGHFYAAHKINQLTSDLFKWSGVNDKTSLFIGTGLVLVIKRPLSFLMLTAKTGVSLGGMLRRIPWVRFPT